MWLRFWAIWIQIYLIWYRVVSWGFCIWLNTKKKPKSHRHANVMKRRSGYGKKKELEGLHGGFFLTPGYILWACQVIHLCCTADIAEDSAMQGRWPQPLYKPQEALRTDDKWPERPRRVPPQHVTPCPTNGPERQTWQTRRADKKKGLFILLKRSTTKICTVSL